MLRLATLLCVLMLVSGCESAPGIFPSPTPPPSPSPSPSPFASVWARVFAEAGSGAGIVGGGGTCIVDASVEVVRGQSTGQNIKQTPCDLWDFGGGAWFTDLIPGVAMTLRASAPGYATQEQTVVPEDRHSKDVIFTLSRIE